MDKTKILETIKKENFVLVCTHVLDQEVNAEYYKGDDSYVCTKCRNIHQKCGKTCSDNCMKDLRMVHRTCLGV